MNPVKNLYIKSYFSLIDEKYLNFKKIEMYKEKYFLKNLLRNKLINELLYQTIPLALTEDDLNSMYYSIEKHGKTRQSTTWAAVPQVSGSSAVALALGKDGVHSVRFRSCPCGGCAVDTLKENTVGCLYEVPVPSERRQAHFCAMSQQRFFLGQP